QNQKVFEVFYKALKGKRLIVFSGLFKEAMTKFKNGELDEYKETDLTKYVYAIMYTWGDKKYLEMEKRLLTEDELEEITGKLIDEKDVDSMGLVQPDELKKMIRMLEQNSLLAHSTLEKNPHDKDFKELVESQKQIPKKYRELIGT